LVGPTEEVDYLMANVIGCMVLCWGIIAGSVEDKPQEVNLILKGTVADMNTYEWNLRSESIDRSLMRHRIGR
jgi:hypothetical protein